MNRIIVVDDEQDFLESVRRGLFAAGFRNVLLISDPREAADRFERGEDLDVALIDITMPHMTGVELLQLIKRISPSTECVMVTAVNEARLAVDCVKQGAYDYLVKPISKEDLILAIRNAFERKRLLDVLAISKTHTTPRLVNQSAFKDIVTHSGVFTRVLREAELHAQSDVPVLITGESGTGKELLARAIHAISPRRDFSFTPVNMASLTATLFDAEFFGYVKGAFTGAEANRVGYLEQTNKGTLFLDEIGHLPLELQGKLLRVLQEGEYFKLGMSRPQRADVRFVAATNADLDALIEKGGFRKDLYYRLKGAWLHLPPIRERKEDIPPLVNHFLRESSPRRDSGKPVEPDEEALEILMNYDYPGNVRELRSILQSAVNLAQGKKISSRLFPSYLRSRKPAMKTTSTYSSTSSVIPLEEVEKRHILAVYDQTNRNKTKASDLLGIGLNTLRRKLASYGVD